ncbi:MAG: hypothetical protein MZV63_38375 [Marinilabiliales bacterium]|nr:hypothetical protein [Marinilabiliales bacterium]
MPELEYNGHTYFGQWFDNYEPTLHDAIMGPVEEFAPLAGTEADPGGNFVKIGVGVLNKSERKNAMTGLIIIRLRIMADGILRRGRNRFPLLIRLNMVTTVINTEKR